MPLKGKYFFEWTLDELRKNNSVQLLRNNVFTKLVS